MKVYDLKGKMKYNDKKIQQVTCVAGRNKDILIAIEQGYIVSYAAM
jgi:hypothetical protein